MRPVLAKAIAGVKAGRPVATVAGAESIPRTSLLRKYAQARAGVDIWAASKRGRPTALSNHDEKRLADWVQECAVRGVGQLMGSVKLRAKQLLAKAGGEFNVKSKTGLPSDSWFKGFARRWTVQLKTPAVLNRARAKAEDPTAINGFFANVVAVAQAKKIGHERWFGADETGFGEAKGRMRAKIVVPASMQDPKLVSGDYFTQHLSLMLGMDTQGHYICPMFIFQVSCSLFILCADAVE